MSKKELLNEAEQLGISVPKGAKVSEIEALIAEHVADTAQSHEQSDPDEAAMDFAVRAYNRNGQVVLAFGADLPDPEALVFDEHFAYVINRDDALQLVADLPNVVHEAGVVASHTG